MNKINLQNVQFLMPNNFRKYALKQEQFKDFQAVLHKFKDFQGLEVLFLNSRTFKFCTNAVYYNVLVTYIYKNSRGIVNSNEKDF